MTMNPLFSLWLVPSVQPAEHSTPQGPSTSSFIISEQFLAMLDKWAEQFARMVPLLSRGNIFSTPKTSVSKVPCQELISNTPFSAPATRPTSPVESLVVQEAHSKIKKDDNKDKRKDILSHAKTKRKTLNIQRSVTALNHRFKLKLPPVLTDVLFHHRLKATPDRSWTNSLV